jgi:CBS domain-containing protein
MLVKDIMTHNVISIAADTSLLKAARLMLQNHISGLPVVNKDGKLVGIVTEADFLKFIVEPEQLDHECKVEEIMTPNPYTVEAEDSLEHLVEVMQRRGIKRLPVVRDGRMVGIVSGANLIVAAPWRISYVEHLVTAWPCRG